MKRYILELGYTNFFIGEARNIIWVNGQANSVTVGDLEIVEGLDKALPIPEERVKETVKAFDLEVYKKAYEFKEIRVLNYNGWQSIKLTIQLTSPFLISSFF